jgi:hypothetical protein
MNESIMFKRNVFRIVFHILSRHADVLSIHLLQGMFAESVLNGCRMGADRVLNGC